MSAVPSSAAGRLELLPYGRQTIDEDDIAAVVEVLRSDWLTCGPAVDRFETALAATCGARHAVVAVLTARIRPLRPIRQDRPTLACRQGFDGMKTKNGQVHPRQFADPVSVPQATDGMTGILHDHCAALVDEIGHLFRHTGSSGIVHGHDDFHVGLPGGLKCR